MAVAALFIIPSFGNSLDVLQLMNGFEKGCIYIQKYYSAIKEYYSDTKRLCRSQVNGWNWRSSC
jgi:hypothetical protein